MWKADKGVKAIATRTTMSQILAVPESEEDELRTLTLCRVGDAVKKNKYETRAGIDGKTRGETSFKRS